MVNVRTTGKENLMNVQEVLSQYRIDELVGGLIDAMGDPNEMYSLPAYDLKMLIGEVMRCRQNHGTGLMVQLGAKSTSASQKGFSKQIDFNFSVKLMAPVDSVHFFELEKAEVETLNAWARQLHEYIEALKNETKERLEAGPSAASPYN
jgi:hypothetical protein